MSQNRRGDSSPNLLPMNGHHAANIPLLGQVKPDGHDA